MCIQRSPSQVSCQRQRELLCWQDAGILDKVTVGPAQEFAANSIPNHSVDLVFCDPVWQNITDYAWLANVSARTLVYGGNLIAQSCSEYLFAHHNIMSGKGLVSLPVLCETLTGLRAFWKYRVSQAWKPYLWFANCRIDKPKSRKGDHVADAYKAGPITKHQHHWQDNIAFFMYYIAKLTDPGDIVFDPFCGTGTVSAACTMLNRHFITCEIDPDTAAIAIGNLAECNVMLPEFAAMLPSDVPIQSERQKKQAMVSRARQLGLL